ncbi:unnamed protein product [Didymodactylos carnosus]|uniref:Uncharacterized protein n=1 Tax=Didymodactylos carnosus TaxID=1234261 RepID=A0A815DP30_9BILA|nr:unnamed protein product [Didymodactylos carnosus]CAF1300602.1 unnamed protein product [Didymodactylos carnosus]CAF3673378.1 unnamed protein product [Didymodactylos carnosus]CAF4123733.1 unnamed protein product [Didymodactylos carnosus]
MQSASEFPDLQMKYVIGQKEMKLSKNQQFPIPFVIEYQRMAEETLITIDAAIMNGYYGMFICDCPLNNSNDERKGLVVQDDMEIVMMNYFTYSCRRGEQIQRKYVENIRHVKATITLDSEEKHREFENCVLDIQVEHRDNPNNEKTKYDNDFGFDNDEQTKILDSSEPFLLTYGYHFPAHHWLTFSAHLLNGDYVICAYIYHVERNGRKKLLCKHKHPVPLENENIVVNLVRCDYTNTEEKENNGTSDKIDRS